MRVAEALVGRRGLGELLQCSVQERSEGAVDKL